VLLELTGKGASAPFPVSVRESPGSNPGSTLWTLRALYVAIRLGASNSKEAPMTPQKVLSMFERQYLEGKAPVDLETTCASFASWLAATWEQLDGEQKTLLLTVGAALWREGYDLRAGAATKDLW
jgi:hypothetical protein